MAKSRLVMGNAAPASMSSNVTWFFQVGSGFSPTNLTGSTQTTEANAQTVYRTAGTFSNLYVRVTTNTYSLSRTLVLRKNAVDATLTVSITNGVTGVFEDTTHTDSIAAADKLAWSINLNAAGSNLAISIIAVTYDATGTTCTGLVCNTGSQNWTTTVNPTFDPIMGRIATTGTNTTEANAKTRIRKAGTFRNLYQRIGSNSSGIVVIRSRKNGANGNQVITTTSNQTGFFEDTTNTDTAAVGDDFNYSNDLASAGVFASSVRAMDFIDATNNYSLHGCAYALLATVLKNVTTYFPLSGDLSTTTTENNVKCLAKDTYTAADLTINVTTNTVSAASSITLRDSGVDTALVATITSNTAGVYSDTTNTAAITATVDLNYKLVTPNSGTSMIISFIDMMTTNVTTQNLIRVPSTDTTTISDSSLTRIKQAFRSPTADTTTVSDSSLTRIRSTLGVPSTDTSTVSDVSLTRMLSAVRTNADTTIAGETLTRNTQAFRTPTPDTTAIADVSTTRIKTLPRAPGTDSSTITDASLIRLLSLRRVPTTDTINIVDSSLTRSRGLLRIPSSDSTTVVDASLTIAKRVSRIPPTDSTTVVDSSLARLLALARLPSVDTSAVSEASLIRLYSGLRIPTSDTTGLSENVTGEKVIAGINYTRSPSADVTTITDSSLIRGLSFLRSPSLDTIAVSDSSLTRMLSAMRLIMAGEAAVTVNENLSASKVQSILRTVSDTTAVTDGAPGVSRMLSALRAPSAETVTIADSSLTRMLQLLRSVGTDTIAINENVSGILITPGLVSRSAFDSVTIADASLIRLLSSVRTSSDNTAITENLLKVKSISRTPTADNVTVLAGTVTRSRSLVRLPTQDTANILEASLIRLLSLARNATDNIVISELQTEILHSRALQETISITEPLLQRIVSVARNVEDIVDITEDLFFQTYHKFVFDSVIVADQLFRERTVLSGPSSYAIPDEVRPLLGNLGSQRTNEQIELAIDAAYDEINTKTNKIPPNEWKDTDHNFGIIKKLTRYIAAKEMAIGIKDFDTKPLDIEIEKLFAGLLQYDTTSDATQDIVISSASETYAATKAGLIWSTRYPGLRKNPYGGEGDTTTINTNT